MLIEKSRNGISFIFKFFHDTNEKKIKTFFLFWTLSFSNVEGCKKNKKLLLNFIGTNVVVTDRQYTETTSETIRGGNGGGEGRELKFVVSVLFHNITTIPELVL